MRVSQTNYATTDSIIERLTKKLGQIERRNIKKYTRSMFFDRDSKRKDEEEGESREVEEKELKKTTDKKQGLRG